MNWSNNQISIKKISLIAIVSIIILWGIISFFSKPAQKSPTGEAPYLNVYNWYGMIPETILRQFETETGIRIRYDLYDNNEILEAKLLAGKSGYDIVFPSACPYIERQIRAGVYQKLDKSKLVNFHHLDPEFSDRMQIIDPGLVYSIPFFWGTFGFAYVEEVILARMPNAPLTSYRMLFDPEVVSKFKSCGVTLLDEAVDVYPAIMAYLGLDPQSSDINDLKAAQEQLLKARPHISRFLGQRFASELVSGEVCLTQAWSGDVQAAAEQAKESKRKTTIRYVIPEEGGTLWIDAICIPKDAPHPENAYLFINFLMRPEISAAITNAMLFPIANKDALRLIKKEIRNNRTLYPEPSVFKRLKLDKIQNPRYEEIRTRYWFIAKQGA
ncbi:MAG: extracellular solute-binding protein [Alphaproteobacteria bacterium]|nr:extracellular solute-binding protein [Alphaproteobacteria bacterium]